MEGWKVGRDWLGGLRSLAAVGGEIDSVSARFGGTWKRKIPPKRAENCPIGFRGRETGRPPGLHQSLMAVNDLEDRYQFWG